MSASAFRFLLGHFKHVLAQHPQHSPLSLCPRRFHSLEHVAKISLLIIHEKAYTNLYLLGVLDASYLRGANLQLNAFISERRKFVYNYFFYKKQKTMEGRKRDLKQDSKRDLKLGRQQLQHACKLN